MYTDAGISMLRLQPDTPGKEKGLCGCINNQVTLAMNHREGSEAQCRKQGSAMAFGPEASLVKHCWENFCKWYTHQVFLVVKCMLELIEKEASLDILRRPQMNRSWNRGNEALQGS
jgi:hypothetical protein